MPEPAPKRVAIDRVWPTVDGGRFPLKCIVGDMLVVEADVFADGHDQIAVAIIVNATQADEYRRTVMMTPMGNDRYRAEISAEFVGMLHLDIEAWIDEFSTWADDLKRRIDARQPIDVELQVGAEIVHRVSEQAQGPERSRLQSIATRLTQDHGPALAADASVRDLVRRHPHRASVTSLERPLQIVVDPERAVFGAWYEIFPRSLGAPDRHGTLVDLRAHLPHIQKMGFDVIYLPPIHPIGSTHRKGPNNTAGAGPSDPGSPWAIGARDGGHSAIHSQLGTLDEFRRLIRAAKDLQLDLALDLAFQCSPDHPWVEQHPNWFAHRPDGTIRHAENPPKRYEDIYPLDFQSQDWRKLWQALLDVALFWSAEGVRIFRVDNPHTKPFAFWEWMIAKVKARHPDTVFLAEAFTRPKVMYRLAKLGFTQSYTYFAWRNQAQEIRDYIEEITRPPISLFFRPNLWPNTPDILTAALRRGGRPMFAVRLILAATLGASYGIYGPAYERLEQRGMANGTEEYLHSEKYELRTFSTGDQPDLVPLITRVNAIRHEHAALRRNDVWFHAVDNPTMLAYSKRAPDGDTILTVVNTDARHRQSGFVDLDLERLGVEEGQTFVVDDLLDGSRYQWQGPRNYVELDPPTRPAHIFRIAAADSK